MSQIWTAFFCLKSKWDLIKWAYGMESIATHTSYRQILSTFNADAYYNSYTSIKMLVYYVALNTVILVYNLIMAVVHISLGLHWMAQFVTAILDMDWFVCNIIYTQISVKSIAFEYCLLVLFVYFFYANAGVYSIRAQNQKNEMKWNWVW